MEKQVKQIHNRVCSLMQDVGNNSLELAWLLGGIMAERLWREFGPYSSFNEWISESPEGKCVHKSYAYKLAKIGARLRPQKEKVEKLIAEKKIGMSDLLLMSEKVEQGLSAEDAINHLEHGTPLPEEHNNTSNRNDPEALINLHIAVPRGDMSIIKLGLDLFAIRNDCRNEHEAFRMWAISESDNKKVPKQYDSYSELILTGKFRCKYCNKIPSSPTWHHIVPRSITGGDYGPLALLCAECHLLYVQPKWREFAKKWGIDVDQVARDKPFPYRLLNE